LTTGLRIWVTHSTPPSLTLSPSDTVVHHQVGLYCTLCISVKAKSCFVLISLLLLLACSEHLSSAFYLHWSVFSSLTLLSEHILSCTTLSDEGKLHEAEPTKRSWSWGWGTCSPEHYRSLQWQTLDKLDMKWWIPTGIGKLCMWELSVWSHMSLEVLAVMATIVYQLEMGLNINCWFVRCCFR
jgi:hypothetical protein